MGKALVIKNVDFGENKVETVEFAGDKSCTAVSVSPSTITFTTIGGTQQLTITKTPADTTDTLSIVSSNENVCTVVEGVVHVVGIGTATITVTCGNQTASVSVTAESLLYSPAWNVGESSTYNTTGGTLVFLKETDSKYLCAAKSIETGAYDEIYGDSRKIHALEIPKGCDSIRVTMDSFTGLSLQTLWYNSNSKPYTSYPTCIECVLKGERTSVLEAGNILEVPENADKFIFTVNSGTTRTAKTDMSDVASAANIKIYAEASA